MRTIPSVNFTAWVLTLKQNKKAKRLYLQDVFVKYECRNHGYFLKIVDLDTVYLTLTDDFDLGTKEKVLPHGIHM